MGCCIPCKRANRRRGRHRAHRCQRWLHGRSAVSSCGCPCNRPGPSFRLPPPTMLARGGVIVCHDQAGLGFRPPPTATHQQRGTDHAHVTMTKPVPGARPPANAVSQQPVDRAD